MNILLSYSHSGSTWVRYIVEYVSKLPTIGFTSEPVGKVCPIGVNLSAEPILNQRNSLLLKEIVDSNKLLFIVRNYKDIYTKEISGTRYFFDKYFELLKIYDEWEGPKYLVYYEDLMKSPSEHIPKILKFLDIEDDKKFIGNYEKHFHCSLGIYRRFIGAGPRGAFVTLSPDQMKTLDDAMLYYDPILYGKYLAHYMYE